MNVIPRKRSGSNSKKTKEKYEILFKNEETEELNDNLLKEIIFSNINCDNFEDQVMKIVNIDQSAVVRKNLNLLLKECLKQLDSGEFWRLAVICANLNPHNIALNFQETQGRLGTP